MWMYKICKGTRKKYTVVERSRNRKNLENNITKWEFFSHSHDYFIKRYSEQEY